MYYIYFCETLSLVFLLIDGCCEVDDANDADNTFEEVSVFDTPWTQLSVWLHEENLLEIKVKWCEIEKF